MTLDELKQLDPKDAGSWPVPVQAVCVFILAALVCVGGYFYIWSDQLTELEAGQAKEEQLKKDFLDKKKKAINLEAYKQQLAEIQQAFGALLKQLPNKAEMEVLLTEINQSGVGRGLLFDLFKPGAEVKTSEFIEQPIDIKVSGSYHDLAGFVSEVAQLSRIVALGNMQLAPTKDGMTMTAVIRTYRMLDEAEQQAIRQAEADAKKKRK